MRISDKVWPAEGYSSLWFNLETLSILFNLYKVIGGIANVKWILGSFFLYIGKGKDVGIFHLSHINADVMESLMVRQVHNACIVIHIFLELKWNWPTHWLITKEIVTVYKLILVFYLDVKLLWEEVVCIKIVLFFGPKPNDLNPIFLPIINFEGFAECILVNRHFNIHFIHNPVLIVDIEVFSQHIIHALLNIDRKLDAFEGPLITSFGRVRKQLLIFYLSTTSVPLYLVFKVLYISNLYFW
jgi:hypothetical protein